MGRAGIGMRSCSFHMKTISRSVSPRSTIQKRSFAAARWAACLLVIPSLVFFAGGCANSTENGALIGGFGGAALGAGIGSLSHARAGEGALIGGAIGAIAGGLIGHGIDKNKEDEKRFDEENRSIREARQSQSPQYAAITTQDVSTWAGRGVKDEIIIDRIERSGTVFHLTAADENQLRDSGVSEQVIRTMKNTAHQ